VLKSRDLVRIGRLPHGALHHLDGAPVFLIATPSATAARITAAAAAADEAGRFSSAA
jgi:hypothetical protein